MRKRERVLQVASVLGELMAGEAKLRWQRSRNGLARLNVNGPLDADFQVGTDPASPLLTINRAPQEWEGVDRSERARRLSRAGVPAVGVRMAVDENGEILTRTNNVFEGYWNQPEETAKALADGWFHTGDGGHTEDAYVVIADRKKDVIITGGENVSSIEVEDCLFSHASVAEVAVIGVPHEKWGETIKALVVLAEGVGYLMSNDAQAEPVRRAAATATHGRSPSPRWSRRQGRPGACPCRSRTA